MKKTLQSLSLLALAAAALIGCSKDDVQSAATATKEVTLTLSAEKPEISNTPEARTVYSDGHILWNTTGEKLRIAYADNGIIAAKATFQIANATEVSADQKTAKFQFQGTVPAEAGAYTLHALYPSAASTDSTLDSQESGTSKIKNPQSPLANSFDPEADVMVGTSVKSYAVFPENEDIAMLYKRLVAHGQITLTGLPFEADETVENVTLTAPEGTKVAGSIRTDLLKKEISYTTNADNYVSLSYTDAPLDADGNFVAWFCSIPFTVEADQTLKIEVSTARGTYTREITARAEGISFKENTRNLLTVNMASADFTPVTGTALTTGQYVIAVKDGETYHAMTSTFISSRRGTQEIVYAAPYLTDNETLVWTVTKTGANTYTIANGEDYLDNNTTSATAPSSSTPVELVLNPSEDGTTYRIPNKKGDRSLARNSTNGFAFYATSGSYAFDLCFIPAEIKAVPVITVAEKTLTLDSDDEAIHKIGVELKNATAEDIVCVAYEGEEGETAAAWFTAEFKTDEAGNGVVEMLAEANTSEEARKGRIILTATTAEGTATATIAVEQRAYDPNAGKGGTDTYVFADLGYSNAADITEVKGDATTLTFAKGSNTQNSPKYYTTGTSARMYANNTLTITGTAPISKVEFKFVTNYVDSGIKANVGSYSVSNTIGTWVPAANEKTTTVLFTASATSRIQEIIVTYGEDGGDTPDPTLPELPQPVIESDGIDITGNEVTLMWEADPDAKDYTVTFSPAALAPQTATADGGMVMETYTLAYDTTYTISIVANPADPTSHNASQPTVLTVTTGEDPSPKITGITWNFDGETTTSNSPIIEFPIEGGDAEVTVSTLNKGSNAIGFSTVSNFEILEDGSESFFITAADNTNGEAKEEKLTLTLGDSTFEITIKQAGGNGGGDTSLPAGTVLWSETWGPSAVSNFTSYTYTGTEEYGITESNFNIKYTVSTGIAISTNAGIAGSNIKGTKGDANLYWAKATTGSFTASDINLHGAQKVTLTFNQSRAYISIAYKIDNGTEISLGTGANGTNTYDINTNGASELTIIFTKTNKNYTSALDNISLKVAE